MSTPNLGIDYSPEAQFSPYTRQASVMPPEDGVDSANPYYAMGGSILSGLLNARQKAQDDKANLYKYGQLATSAVTKRYPSDPTQTADPWASMLQGGVAGYEQGQNVDRAAATDRAKKAEYARMLQNEERSNRITDAILKANGIDVNADLAGARTTAENPLAVEVPQDNSWHPPMALPWHPPLVLPGSKKKTGGQRVSGNTPPLEALGEGPYSEVNNSLMNANRRRYSYTGAGG